MNFCLSEPLPDAFGREFGSNMQPQLLFVCMTGVQIGHFEKNMCKKHITLENLDNSRENLKVVAFGKIV